jgi:hypothetical protein
MSRLPLPQKAVPHQISEPDGHFVINGYVLSMIKKTGVTKYNYFDLPHHITISFLHLSSNVIVFPENVS